MGVLVLGLGLLLRLIWSGIRGVFNRIGELRRRMARVYHAGYALVPSDSVPGSEFEGERIVVARDPVWLAIFAEPGVIARVTQVRGIGSSARRQGWWWTAQSVQVVELFPYWVAFGPDGLLVDRIIGATLVLSDAQAAQATSTVDKRTEALLVFADDWRQVAVGQVRRAMSYAIRQHIAAEIVGPSEVELEGVDLDEANFEFDRRVRLWRSAEMVATHAALAACFIDELDSDTVRRLTVDWSRLIEWGDERSVVPNHVWARVKRGLRNPLAQIDRHPTLAVIATMLVVFPLLFVAPVLAVLLYVGLLVAVIAAIGLRRLRRSRRARRRRWEPRGDIENVSPSPDRLRRAMTRLGDVPNPVLSWHLGNLLDRANLWVALAGPEPEEPDRTLDWLRRTGRPAQVEARMTDVGPFALAYTDDTRHRAAKLHEPIRWTARVSSSELFAHVARAGLTGIAVDPGCDPSVTSQRPPDQAPA